MTYEGFIRYILDTRGRFVDDYDGYKERHHIVMRSLGGSDDSDNLIDLIGSEHYEAHRLLALENPDCREAQLAWWMMCRRKDIDGKEYEVSAEDWLEARSRWSKLRSGEGHPMYGKHQTDDAKARISESLKGKMAGAKNPMYGKHLSDEHKEKLSKALKGKMAGEKHPAYGTHWTDEMRRKFIAANTGKKRTEEQRKNISNALIGHIVSEESRAKMSAAKKGKYLGENNHMYGKHLSDETKSKLSESHKGMYDGSKNPRALRCICDGIIYGCIKDCAEHYNVKPDTMSYWLKNNKIPQRFVDLGLSYI